MKWLEIIELRSADNKREFLEQELKHLTIDLNIETEQLVIKIYNHLTVDSDFSIHLVHDSKTADIDGSPLALQLVSTLKEYGLINHKVWVERFSK